MVQIPFSGISPPGKFSRLKMKEPINKIFNIIFPQPNVNCNFLFLNINKEIKDINAEKKKIKLNVAFAFDGSGKKSNDKVTKLSKFIANNIEINPARNK